MIEQIIISMLSITSVGLAYWPGRDLRLFGAIAGLCAQPVWVYLIVANELWGIAPLTPVYTLMYVTAFAAHLKRYRYETKTHGQTT